MHIFYLVYLHAPTGPPVLECVNEPPPNDPTDFFIIKDMDIGCDLCIESGQSVDILTIMCIPRTNRIPYECTITTPNGTNVLDIVDPSGNYITVQREGDTVKSVSMSPVSSPDYQPLGFDVLGTWTCQCNNSDGQSVASSKLGSCCELYVYSVHVDSNFTYLTCMMHKMLYLSWMFTGFGNK